MHRQLRDAHAKKDEHVSLRSDFNAGQLGYSRNPWLTCSAGSMRTGQGTEAAVQGINELQSPLPLDCGEEDCFQHPPPIEALLDANEHADERISWS